MRKGTRSCLTCRKRKVRCVMTANALVCDLCVRRDVPCLDQELRIPYRELSQRKTEVQKTHRELQVLISQVLQKIPSKSRASKTELAAAEALSRLQSEIGQRSTDVEPSLDHGPVSTIRSPVAPRLSRLKMKSAPLLSLFNNDILQQVSNDEAASCVFPLRTMSDGSSEKISQIAASLRAVLPNNHDLTLLMKHDFSIWQIWRKTFPDIRNSHPEESEQAQPASLFCHVSSCKDAISVAKALLCSALCVQQMYPITDLTHTQLPNSPEALQQRFIAPVEDYLSYNESDACTVDGLQCMLLQTRLYINIGMPHRAWLIFRRAIGYAYLLELHRQPMDSAGALHCQKRAIWFQLWHGERYLSVLLGLPYSAVDNVSDKPTFDNGIPPDLCGDYLRLKLGIIAGKLIDRDQSSSASDILKTMQIDRDLNAMKAAMPKNWWEIKLETQTTLNTVADILSTKFTYYNIRKLLHLPFMLLSTGNPQYLFSKIAAIEASREMINCYRVMRNFDRPLFTVCSLADFQVFTAAMVLVLNLLDNPLQSHAYPTLDQVNSDWAMVNILMQDFKRVSEETSSGVAKQAGQILDEIFQLQLNPSNNSQNIYQAVIPYFGKLTIKTGDRARTTRIEMEALTGGYDLGLFLPSSNSAHPLGQSIEFESYFALPEENHTGHILSTGWNTAPDFNLCDDWALFLPSDELE